MIEFLEMGGHARYVWPSYVLTLSVVALNIYWARRALARSREQTRRRISIQEEGV